MVPRIATLRLEQKRQELEAKTRTYRLLHLELQSIKAAVKKFVDQRNNAH